MKQQAGVCEECGRRTAVTYAHANLCEWCWPAHAKSASADPASARPAAPPQRTCRECGAWLTDLRRERCLDCEVNRAFDALGEKIEARRRSNQATYSRGGTI